MGTIINPSSNNWYLPTSGITVMGTTKTYATYAAMLRDPAPGKLAWVQDATGDPTVDQGSALYAWQEASRTWLKIYETEIMDDGQGQSVQNFVGWIENPEALTTAYPEGQNGWYAIVGTTDTIWVWDTDTASWRNTSRIEWRQIVGRPESHPISFITGLEDALAERPTTQVIESEYVKKTDTIAWDSIAGAPEFVTPEYLIQNYSPIGHVHNQYITSTVAATTYAPITHKHSAADLEGSIVGAPRTIQLVCPVSTNNVYLTINVFSDASMETIVKSIDSRTAEGRAEMMSFDGTRFVEFPAQGLSSAFAGGFTLVNLGDIDTTTMKYVKWAWIAVNDEEVISASFGYPALTPTDMVSVGNFWRQIPEA